MSQTKQAEYAMELKLTAVRRVRAGESVRAVAEELGIRRKRLYVWKDRYVNTANSSLLDVSPRKTIKLTQSSLSAPPALPPAASSTK
jgi:transposase-like protein